MQINVERSAVSYTHLAEKRKAAKLDRELEKMAAEDDYEDDGMYGVNQFEEEDPYETGQLQ